MDTASQLPRPLYEDILHGRWVPIVGAGMSRNARVSSGDAPPDWNGLASTVREELTDPEDSFDAVDVISAYAQEHGRPALVERVARAIRLADAEPGRIHLSLCKLPLDILMTTNFDALLEHAFRAVGKPCNPVVDELQLAITNPYPGPTLLKMHGDITRPDKMVLTEEDFDRFLIRNPLLSTVIASHFAQRSIVLIGYSLSDPDLRQLLALVRERLGEGARAIYALEVDPPAARVARFERRHVKVVSLRGDRANPEPALRELFDDLFNAIGAEAPSTLTPRTHDGGLALQAADLQPRGCFLSTSPETQADYIEWLSPVLNRAGLPILSPFDFISRGDNIISTLDAMIASASCAIIEIGPAAARAWETGTALNRLSHDRVLIVVPPDEPTPIDVSNVRYYTRPTTESEWEEFADLVARWIQQLLDRLPYSSPSDETLLVVGRIMHLAAVLEETLGDRLALPVRLRSLSQLIRQAANAGLIGPEEKPILSEFLVLRNSVAHGRRLVTSGQKRGAARGVDGLMSNVQQIITRVSQTD